LLIVYTCILIYRRYRKSKDGTRLPINVETEHDQTGYERLATTDEDDA